MHACTQASISLAAGSTVTELTHDVYGFEVTGKGGDNHAFAVHSAETAASWVSAVRAMIPTSTVENPAPIGVQTGKADADSLADLDELDELDIPDAGGELDDLAELPRLSNLFILSLCSLLTTCM